MSAKGRKILIVDDHDTFRSVLSHTLRFSQYQVVEARSGRECLELARKEKPDLILLDIAMPGMSGHETYQLLKENPETKDIPIVVLTALKDQDAEREVIEAKVQGYLRKPCDLSELEKCIESCLQK